MLDGFGAGWSKVLCGILLASLGAALHYGSLTHRGFPPDECAHVAYAEAIEHGELPDVGTIIPNSRAKVCALASPTDAKYYIYVANHPPLFAAVQAGSSLVLTGTGLVTDPELAVGRSLNALCTLLAVLVTAYLGRAVSGSPSVGVLSAGLFAAVPAVWPTSTYGYSDGGSVLAVVLVVWAGVNAWQRTDRCSLAWLAVAVAGAGMMRATALIAAVAVAALVAVRHSLRTFQPRTSGPADRGQKRRTPSLEVIFRAGGIFGLAVLPAVAVSGWWYARNWSRFGDPTASHVLIQRLHRVAPSGGITTRLIDVSMWRQMISYLVTYTYPPPFAPQRPRFLAGAIGMIALLALAGLAARAVRKRPDSAVLYGWPVLFISIAAIIFGIAGHTSTGGAPHQRYLLLALPQIIVFAVLGLDRVHRSLPSIALIAATAGSAAMFVTATRWIVRLQHQTGAAPMGPPGLRLAGLALIVVGILMSLTSGISLIQRPKDETAARA